MFGLGATELIIILVIILIIFGAGKLPEISGAIGKSLKNFRKASGADGEGADGDGEGADGENKDDAGKSDKGEPGPK